MSLSKYLTEKKIKSPRVLKRNKLEDYKYLMKCFKELYNNYEKTELEYKKKIEYYSRLNVSNLKESNKKIQNIKKELEKEYSNKILNLEIKILKEKEEKEEKEIKEITINDLLDLDLEFEDKFFEDNQRRKVQDHLNELEKRIIEKPMFINSFYIVLFNNKKYLIDGQHRYTICKKIKKENNIFYNEKIKDLKIKIIEDNTCNTEGEVKEKYETLNYNQGHIHITKSGPINWDKLIDKLNKKYEKYFKSDKGRCNKPYVRINDFIRTLQDNFDEIKGKLNIEKENDLYKKLEILNNYYYYNWLDKPDISGLRRIRNMYYSQNIPMFFYGIEKNWLDDLINLNNYNKRSIQCVRPFIPKKFREMIFIENVGVADGLCVCCFEEKITIKNFDLAHIIPIVSNGLSNRYNLRPTCSHCNKKMGNKKMFDYMIKNNINKEYGIQLKTKYEICPTLYQFNLDSDV